METVASEIGRDASGRFVPGQSGNPAGKKLGTKNRKTLMMEALRDGEDVAAARVVIDKALSGDAVAARFVVALVSPKPRERTIHLELPEDDDCNVVTAFNVTLRALCDGEITPDEALQVSRFLDGRRKVLQAWQLEEKLTSYGRTIPGDPDWAPDEDGEEQEDEDDDEMTEAEAIAVALYGVTPTPPAATATAQSAASPLQSACISRSPRPLGDASPPRPARSPRASCAASTAPRRRDERDRFASPGCRHDAQNATARGASCDCVDAAHLAG